MSYVYNLILYHPLLNVLVFFYDTIAFQDLGLAIIFLTLLIRLILFPIFQKSARHQVVMQRLQPELKKIQEFYKKDKEKQTQAMMALYKEHSVNPFAGMLFLFIQIPILITLYQIVLASLKPGVLAGLYSFVVAPQSINQSLFGLINLGGRSIFIVALAALAQYFQAKLSLPQTGEWHKLSQAEKISKQMVFVGPLMTLVIFFRLPAAVSLYWLTASVFSIIQQIIVNKGLDNGSR